MRRTICQYGLCLSLLLTGCGMTNKVAGVKPKPGGNSDSPVNEASSVGSPDFSSKKPIDPVKLHLAYAAWHEQSGNYKEARESYLKVLEKSRKNTEAMLGIARVDRAYGRDAEADLQLKKALKYHPKDPTVLVAIGQAHASKKEWAEALEKMRAAHSLAPYDTIYEFHLAVVEARAGEIPRSLEHFTRSVGEAEGHFNVGYILKEQGHTAEAEAHLIKALKLKPDLKQAETVLASIRSSNMDEVQPASYKKVRP